MRHSTSSFLTLVLYLLSIAYAISGDFKINSSKGDLNTLEFSQDTSIELTAEVKSIDINFDLQLSKSQSTPKQVSIAITDPENENNEIFYFPIINKKNQYFVSLNVKKLSNYFKSLDTFDINLIIGDDKQKELNQITKIGQVQVSDDIHQLYKYEKPIRYGAKPEIHHIFRGDPKQVSSIVSLVFILGVALLTVGLFASWARFDSINFKNLSDLPVGFTVQFLAVILLIEVVIFDYYLKTSIFTTIFRLSIFALIAVYLGSKVLQSLYYIRTK